MKKKPKIYIKQWLELKPYKTHSPSDLYYLNLCNQVYEAVISSPEALMLRMYLEPEEIMSFSCFLVSYFEDLISGTNIWNTFVRQHEALEGKIIPFYDTEDYFEEEINQQDVTFLIWYFINSIQEERFLSPHNDFMSQLASTVMEIFEEAWEEAPENTVLKQYYQLDANCAFYDARNLMDTLLFKTYLFYPDTHLKLLAAEIELVEENRKDPNLAVLLNDNRDIYVHTSYTRLLSLQGKEWAAALLGKEHPLHDALLQLSPRVQGYFLYKGQDATHITLEYIASSKPFRLLKESFEHAHTLKEIDTLVFIGVVNWQGDWWFSGVHFIQPYDPVVVTQERNSLESKKRVAFLEHQEEKALELLEEQREKFLEFNGGSPIAFMPSAELGEFYKEFIVYYNQSLNLSNEQLEETQERTSGKVVEEDFQFKEEDFSDMPEDGLIFFNPKSGGEIAVGITSAFPSKDNPFYDPADSKESVIELLMSKEFSTELVHYCIDHYKDELPFFQEDPGRQYLEDLNFLLRFWKVENYHTSFAMSFV